MTITYQYENSLYVNITNRCTNSCDFCIRTNKDGFYAGDLWLEREPTEQEAANDILSHDLSKYDELVFCGYGEPTERLDVMLNICRKVKEKYNIKIRLNTNGHSDLIYGSPTASMFKGLIDTVSISLNASDAQKYNKICHCRYGDKGFYSMLNFAKEVKEYVPHVILSIVKTDETDDLEIDRCKNLAAAVGVPLRIREMIK